MNLRMSRQDSGEWRPDLLCDQCGLPIDQPELAMVIWTDPAGWSTGHAGDQAIPYVVHKGRCDYDLAGSQGGHRPWYELTDVLERLWAIKPMTRTSEILAGMRRARGVGK